MEAVDVYLYGMNLITTMHLLAGDYPKPDCYCEIKKSYAFPGGETGSCAIALTGLGCHVKVDGTYLGQATKEPFLQFFSNLNVDTSRLHFDESFEGLQDLVLIDKDSRTVFGKFNAYFSDKLRRWSIPSKADIQNAQVVGLDPFFDTESIMAARYCHELHKKYVTIDCPSDSELCRYAEATVISNEFIRNHYEKIDIDALFEEYTSDSDALVIFTFGSNAIYFGRKGGTLHKMLPYKVNVESTLGAGDTFKAGIIYGVLHNMKDQEMVSFAAATAAYTCSHFPLALNPPTLEEIYKIMALS